MKINIARAIALLGFAVGGAGMLVGALQNNEVTFLIAAAVGMVPFWVTGALYKAGLLRDTDRS